MMSPPPKSREALTGATAQVLCGVLEGIVPGYFSADMPSLRVDLKALDQVPVALLDPSQSSTWVYSDTALGPVLRDTRLADGLQT